MPSNISLSFTPVSDIALLHNNSRAINKIFFIIGFTFILIS